jgi:hypothetical protein
VSPQETTLCCEGCVLFWAPNKIAFYDVKVEAIIKMVAPTDASELRVLLGTYNYHQKFIWNFVRKAAPLKRLL